MSENAETGVGELLNATGLLERVSDQALHLVPAAQGVLVGLCDQQYVTYVSGAGFLAPHVGTRVDKDASLSGLAMRTRQIVHCGDTEQDPHADLEACRRLRVTSSVCIPLCRGDEVLGVICVSSSRRNAFCDADIDLMTRLADVMGVAVGLAADLTRVAEGTSFMASYKAKAVHPDSPPLGSTDSAVNDFVLNVLQPDAASLRHRRDRIQAVLDHPEMLTMVFQPIVDIERQLVVGVEALARFEGDPQRTPDQWFADAHLVGLGVELEMCAVSKACACLDLLPSAWSLGVNVGPETIMSPVLTEVLSGYDPLRIVVELTEQRRVLDYPGLVTTLQRLRESGCRFAVDDAGAGFASLSHILKLAPNFIKLDRDLVAGINFDPVRRVLVGALMTFATDTGSQIIAEGVEDQEEMDALQCLGVRLFQGFLIKRPTPIERLLLAESDLFRPVSPLDGGVDTKRPRRKTRDDCGRLRAIGRWGAMFK
jgi:EAL domain-containing protein (putative c-di-GMP-specific phosphodiesterase class I)